MVEEVVVTRWVGNADGDEDDDGEVEVGTALVDAGAVMVHSDADADTFNDGVGESSVREGERGELVVVADAVKIRL